MPKAAIVVIAALALWAQGGQQSATRAIAPLVVQADLPLYPAAAWGLRISGKVVVHVEVDGNGQASAAVKESNNKYLTAPTLANTRSWRFQRGMPGSFDVTYRYQIEGSATEMPQSPMVVLNLPYSVTVTVRPSMPTVAY